ncbi:hypothetical protein GCM10010862_22240 [Devosia nitrariae]|uniref:Sulfotransferase family protein n=2 Tax=Devosia nitrariae TaxID=2071872 RepID=A0ABQ5W4H0_9HYPH|nr:hypothetical protein GCM10010862_22240 [Devosia nitrariae]
MRRVPNTRSSLLLALAEGGLTPLSIVTVRDPIDSWLSSRENGWLHEVESFDEYCRRFLLLVRHFEPGKIFRYEDFVRNPQRTTQAICFALELDFDPQFATRMSTIRLTGDSGRKSNEIVPRPRRTMAPEIVREVMASVHYAEISNQLGYGLQGSVEKE